MSSFVYNWRFAEARVWNYSMIESWVKLVVIVIEIKLYPFINSAKFEEFLTNQDLTRDQALGSFFVSKKFQPIFSHLPKYNPKF